MRTTIYLAQKVGVNLARDQVLLRCLPQTGGPNHQAKHIIQWRCMQIRKVCIDAIDVA
jgi:hypothetical protein